MCLEQAHMIEACVAEATSELCEPDVSECQLNLPNLPLDMYAKLLDEKTVWQCKSGIATYEVAQLTREIVGPSTMAELLRAASGRLQEVR